MPRSCQLRADIAIFAGVRQWVSYVFFSVFVLLLTIDHVSNAVETISEQSITADDASHDNKISSDEIEFDELQECHSLPATPDNPYIERQQRPDFMYRKSTSNSDHIVIYPPPRRS